MNDISQSEDWLGFLLYTLDVIITPTPRKILQTFESWDYEHRLRPQLRRLERARLLQRQGRGPAATCTLTAAGRLAAQGGVNPVERWRRAWDGRWRLLLFDFPARKTELRLRVWRWLRRERFGYLQNSVWLSPDPVNTDHVPLALHKLTAESFVVLESRPVPPDSDAGLVQAAWDFALVNRRYQSALDLATAGLKLAESPGLKAGPFRAWLASEREAWHAAVESDPLLPESLLPPGYLGREAWTQRQAAFAALARRTCA